MVTATETKNGHRPLVEEPQPAQAGALGSVSRIRTALQRFNPRPLIVPAAVVAVLIAGVFIVNAVLGSVWYVSTDNAQVSGTPVPVAPVNGGRVEDIYVQVGSQVHRGEALARIVLPALFGSAPVQEEVRAPFDGVVIEIPVGIGAEVSAGQNIVTVVDPGKLYVSANIDENSVGRVQIGQPVDVHVDALSRDVPGQITAITNASTASFSLLPSQNNSSGSFTKVNQNVPVRVDVDDLSNQPLLVGTSVEVKIHVAGH